MNENPNIPTKKYHILQNIGYMISFYRLGCQKVYYL